MKYIMFEHTIGRGKEAMKRRIPIIFPESLTHACVAEAMAKEIEMQGAVPVSAGFVKISIDGTHGESESLRLKPIRTDELIINTSDYLGGLTGW